MRHYYGIGAKVIVHDGGPIGMGLIIGAENRRWDTKGQLNDELAMKLKNECWRGTDADWVIVADADEILYFPEGAEKTLETYTKRGAAMIKPLGYEMFSDALPTGRGEIYDEIKMGARDDKWYAKPILFTPHKIIESGFGIGAHEATPVLKSGRSIHVGLDWPQATPHCLLLHYHQIGGLQRIAERYDATRKRLSRINEKQLWGNFKPGLEHAQEKRDYILPLLEQVIP